MLCRTLFRTAQIMADNLLKLEAQYFQLVEPRDLHIPPEDVLLQPAIQQALYERMFDESLPALPPAAYRTRVLKLITTLIEDAITDPDEDELNDNLMEAFGTLLAQPKPNSIELAQQLSSVKYTAPRESSESRPREVVTIESRGLILSGGTTGNRTWEAALHLGSFLATPEGDKLVRGKRVIELGAGTGFLSLFCARHLGVRSVVASDREPSLIANMQDCAVLNSDNECSLPFFPALWNWGTPLEISDDMPSLVENDMLSFDVALGADLIYDTDIIPLLLSTIEDLFENYHVKKFVISATLRNENTFQTFLDGCEQTNFRVEKIPYESIDSQSQSGFFHSTSIPIVTYQISKGGE